MRKIITTTFVTLDGVMQAPGGPQEDTSGGFKYGGWMGAYWDKEAEAVINGFMALPSELLLGKRTYDIFSAYWPYSKEEPVAGRFNSTRKWVVSDKPAELSWHNSTLITGDVLPQLTKLKGQSGPDLWVWGSGYLIQSLLANRLVDAMYVWTFPVTVGSGKRLFAEGTPAQAFKLTESKVFPAGAIFARYEPAGPLQIVSQVSGPASEAELARRKKMKDGTW